DRRHRRVFEVQIVTVLARGTFARSDRFGIRAVKRCRLRSLTSLWRNRIRSLREARQEIDAADLVEDISGALRTIRDDVTSRNCYNEESKTNRCPPLAR